jgi:hypothetical protein
MYYTDPKDPGTEHPNGCKSFDTPGHHHLSKVSNCPVAGTTLRLTATISGEPDTWFSIPAKIQYKRKTISGFISADEDGFHFVPYQYGKNYHILNQK